MDEYNKALEKARNIHRFSSDIAEIKRMEELFPSLTESKDEEIRKALYHLVARTKELYFGIDNYGGVKWDNILAWLEKQKPLYEKDIRYKYLDELLVADDIYQMSMNDDMIEEARQKAISALSQIEISKLLGIEKRKSTDKVEPFKIEAGKYYTCIKDYELPDFVPFKKGKVYKSEYDNNLIDADGYVWPFGDAKDYFRPATEEEILDKEFKDSDPNYPYRKDGLKTTKETEYVPRFKVGDWIVYGQTVAQVIEVDKYTFTAMTTSGETFYPSIRELEEARLWDISKDAKDGDVLFCGDSLVIFRRIVKTGTFESYCDLTRGQLDIDVIQWDIYDFHPATQSQKEALFKAMADAGYQWDAEKKELKKIEQKPVEPNWLHHKVDLSNCSEEYRKAYYDGWNNCNQQHSQLQAEQKPAEWSEEDKDMLEGVIRKFQRAYPYQLHEENPVRKEIDWLKSLRPQKQWKPSDDQLETLEWQLAYITQDFRHYSILKKLLEDLKQLKTE